MNLLVLRGLLQDPGSWAEFGERLRARAPGLNAFTLDLPGVGTECGRPSPASIPALRIDLAKRFHERIARGRWPAGPWILAGSGIEAMVALDWVAAEPALFARLVLVNPSSADVAPARERFRFAARGRVLWGLCFARSRPGARAILRAVSNRFHRQDPKMRGVEDSFAKARRERPTSPATALRHLRSAADFTLPAFPAPRGPRDTLVCTSRGDRIARPESSIRLAQRLGAAHVAHPWAGHDLAIDDPEWLAREVSDWSAAAW